MNDLINVEQKANDVVVPVLETAYQNMEKYQDYSAKLDRAIEKLDGMEMKSSDLLKYSALLSQEKGRLLTSAVSATNGTVGAALSQKITQATKVGNYLKKYLPSAKYDDLLKLIFGESNIVSIMQNNPDAETGEVCAILNSWWVAAQNSHTV